MEKLYLANRTQAALFVIQKGFTPPEKIPLIKNKKETVPQENLALSPLFKG